MMKTNKFSFVTIPGMEQFVAGVGKLDAFKVVATDTKGLVVEVGNARDVTEADIKAIERLSVMTGAIGIGSVAWEVVKLGGRVLMAVTFAAAGVGVSLLGGATREIGKKMVQFAGKTTLVVADAAVGIVNGAKEEKGQIMADPNVKEVMGWFGFSKKRTW